MDYVTPGSVIRFGSEFTTSEPWHHGNSLTLYFVTFAPGFDPHRQPVFGHGSIAKCPLLLKDNTDIRVIKYGRTTGFTVGTLISDGVMVKEHDTLLELEDGVMVKMKRQYIVKPLGKKPFFKSGDSGSGVFLVDKENKLTCIGLAIGCLDEMQTVVTPIEYVLKALGLPLDSMQFEEDKCIEDVNSVPKNKDHLVNVKTMSAPFRIKEELYQLSSKLSEELKGSEKDANFIVWPGTDLANQETVFVCLYQGIMQTTLPRYEGMHIYYKDSETPSRPFESPHKLPIDHNWILCHKDAELLQQVIEKHGSVLFKQHSNLEAITGSAFVISKSMGYIKCPSVVLYCQVKGIAPIGEDAFPTSLTVAEESIRVKVDVREGYLRQGMYRSSNLGKTDHRDKFCMGISIGVENGGKGTFGPFVKINDKDVGFLTCAHVILPDPTKTSARQNCKGLRVFQPADGESHHSVEKTREVRYCGRVSEIVFNESICDPKNGLIKKVGVDAALVTVSDNRKGDVRSFPFIPDMDLKNAGFDPPHSPMFGHGSIAKYPLEFKTYHGKRVIKYGRTSGLTIGTMSFNGGMIKVKDAKLQLPDKGPFVIMDGQYIVERKGGKYFFELGDSGSGVFVLDENNQLMCIGLAIGCLDDWETVVTPIEYVLKALGLGLDSMEFEKNMDVQDVPTASTSAGSATSATHGSPARKKRKTQL